LALPSRQNSGYKIYYTVPKTTGTAGNTGGVLDGRSRELPHRNPDGKDACRIGARLKDLGGKGFAFYKMGMGGIDLLGKIKGVTA